MDNSTSPFSNTYIAFCEMLVERITTLEAEVEDLKGKMRLSPPINGRYTRMRKGKTVIFEVSDLIEYSEFPDIWSIECDFPFSRFEEHMDEVEAVLEPGWKGVIECLRKSVDMLDVTVADIPMEYRGVLEPRGADQVITQVEGAYLKARLALKMVIACDSLTVQGTKKMKCIEDVFSLYFDIGEALWDVPEDNPEYERKVYVYPNCHPTMKRDLKFELKSGLLWTDGCRALVSGWSRKSAIGFLVEHSSCFGKGVIEKICSIHGITRFQRYPDPDYCYK